MKLRTKVKRLKEENERLKKMPMEPRHLIKTNAHIQTLKSVVYVSAMGETDVIDMPQFAVDRLKRELSRAASEYITIAKTKYPHEIRYEGTLIVGIPEDQV